MASGAMDIPVVGDGHPQDLVRKHCCFGGTFVAVQACRQEWQMSRPIIRCESPKHGGVYLIACTAVRCEVLHGTRIGRNGWANDVRRRVRAYYGGSPTKPPSINGLTRHSAQHLSVDIIHWVAVRDADRSTRTRRPRFHGGAQRTSGSVPRILDGAAYSVPAKAWANTVRSASTVAHTQSGVV